MWVTYLSNVTAVGYVSKIINHYKRFYFLDPDLIHFCHIITKYLRYYKPRVHIMYIRTYDSIIALWENHLLIHICPICSWVVVKRNPVYQP